MEVNEVHNCTITFLSKGNSREVCSKSVTLDIIKKIKQALHLKQFGDCQDLKPCKDVRYQKEETFSNFNPRNPTTEFMIYYAVFMVEQLEDSYVYSFISIFSEIGGSLGVLIGLSCMTIIDFFIEIYEKFFKI